ncbi:MAG TPA: hypothetical protein VMZ31_17430 [Phycisphaerae bacterium]|nr:hypothetical protein [Phycisphaerae bacterium]
MTKRAGPSSRSPDRRVILSFLRAGPVLLFVLAATYGDLEQHHSNDTWIALDAGRQIIDELGYVPKVDTFSYTFNGKPWFNQNWLSHVMYYWLYSRISPDAAVYGKYLICAAMFLLMLAAARARSRSWMAALIGTAIVSAASLRWLSPRPESSGFLCMAGLMACLAWLSNPDKKKRLWPALLLLPWFVVWGCAHGSFIFGYGMVVVFLGCWALTRLVRPKSALTSDRQVIAIVACTLAAVIITVIVSPFGVENLTHPFKVAESEVFRRVSEWRPPYVTANFPPALPFWVALATGVAALGAAVAVRSAWAIEPKQRNPLRPPTPWGLFDLAAIIIGLYMAMWARRFAPILYIVALPSLLVFIMRLLWPIPRRVRDAWQVLALASWVGSVVLAIVIVRHVDRCYVAPYANRHSFDPDRASFNLLERTIQYDRSPGIAIEFLKRNNFQANLVTHWVYAGPVMFHAPGVKVYIDGRSQQVYSEEHYIRFQRFWTQLPPNLPPARYEAARKRVVQRIMQVLDESGTDAVMLRMTPSTRLFLPAIDTSPQWVLTLYTGTTHLYLRRGCDMLSRVRQAEQEGRLWWPELPEALIARAHLWLARGPDGFQQSLTYFRAAVDGRLTLGLVVYPRMVDLWLRMGRPDYARQYLREQAARIRDPAVGLSDGVRRNLLARIEQIQQAMDRREAPGTAAPETFDAEQKEY